MGKRLLALVLDVQKLRNFPITVKGQSNSRCLVDVYTSTLPCALLSCNAHLGYLIYHIGVGFCVARSDCDGQCEGLCAWDG